MKNFPAIICCILFICQLSGSFSIACASDDKIASTAAAIATAAATTPAPAAGEEYCGEYFLPSGKRVSVYMMGVIPAMVRLTFINWENGRAGALTSDGPDRYWAALSPLQAETRQTAIAFGRGADNSIEHLTIQEGTAPEVRADLRKTFEQRNITFANGDAVLSGVLKTPLGKGPFPAVVLVHGSGPGGREQMESMSRFFVHLGMAVVSYDKRGCGASGGDWKQVDLETLADDALAAVSMLASEPGIDPKRIGLWGISQGGWITPLAASRSNKVAFVINHSGPGTSLRRQDTYMMTSTLKSQGVPAEDIELAVQAMNILYDYGRKKATIEQLEAAVDKLRGKPGLEEFTSLSADQLVPDSLYARQAIGDPAWFFHLDPDRDALQPYRLLRCPLLVVYGKLDYTIPVEESEAKISAVLKESAHPDYLVKVLERTGHGMSLMNPDEPNKPAEPLSIAPEYFSLIEEWLKGHGMCGIAE
ncbi:MAG: alpha/beta fold hydrolase [Chitinivibrionia bacterium]|nr:alpha/beta fold hydrolase [Chitinivibrionia bacterium]